MTLDISIVVPCRGHARELELCLASLLAQETSAKYEIIVVDSAFDPEIERVVRAMPPVQLVRSKQPLLTGAARNLGIRHASSDTIGLVDADCVCSPGWVEAALQTVRQGALLGGGSIEDSQPWNWIASSDNRLQYADFPSSRPPGPSDYFPGAALVAVKSAVQELGGFDEILPHGQDVLFTSRAQARWPGRVMFNPLMGVRHPGRTNLKAFREHQERFGYARGRQLFRVTPGMRWIGGRRYLLWILILRRLAYIILRVIQWKPLDLPRLIWQLPLLLIGLAAWSEGFRRGIGDRSYEAKP